MPPKRKAKNDKDATKVKAIEGDKQVERDNVSGSTHIVPRPSGLTLEHIQAALFRYQDHVSQLSGAKSKTELQALDEWRLKELPGLVRSRKPACIDKQQLEKLMEWKLTRGKFRPTLPGLIAQNTPSKVKSITQDAFSSLCAMTSSRPSYQSFRTILKSLCGALKGVGPATGSLLLSIYDDRVPFMSDEAYIWIMYADQGTKKKDVKYTEKGYLDYAVRMWDIAEKVGTTPAELEKVGWVFGREWISGGTLGPIRGVGENSEVPDETHEDLLKDDPDMPNPKRQKR
ncbi:hypothetical protein OPQ81_010102 [Rhizoctonia solani]|nr:hypothetical protein OPQ81_010102 [Rhizoctonia solani]